MNENLLIQEALLMVDEVPNNPNLYMAGVLFNDSDTQNYIEALARVQAVIIQSIQVNNPKRAIRYIGAFNLLLKNNVSLTEHLRETLTDYLLSSPIDNNKN